MFGSRWIHWKSSPNEIVWNKGFDLCLLVGNWCTWHDSRNPEKITRVKGCCYEWTKCTQNYNFCTLDWWTEYGRFSSPTTFSSLSLFFWQNTIFSNPLAGFCERSSSMKQRSSKNSSTLELRNFIALSYRNEQICFLAKIYSSVIILNFFLCRYTIIHSMIQKRLLLITSDLLGHWMNLHFSTFCLHCFISFKSRILHILLIIEHAWTFEEKFCLITFNQGK